MRQSVVFLAAAFTAVYAQDSDPCQVTYRSCVAAGTAEVACACDLTACLGEDNARNREYCATATAGLTSATSTATASIVTGTIVQPSGAPQITAPAGSVALGQPCGADEQCGEGVQCFGSTAGTIRTCGNFNAACSQDSQCAFNTCDNGLCRGFLPSSAYPAATQSSSTATSASSVSTSSVSIVTGTIVQPSGAPQVTAPAGSLALGEACGADEQCAAGVECWGSNAGIIRRCGNFNAGCKQDSQCAYNSCNNGLCNGFLPSSAYPAATNSVSFSNGTSTAVPTGTVYSTGAANPTGNAGPSSSLTPYTGDASVGAAFSGLAAIVAGAAAWML